MTVKPLRNLVTQLLAALSLFLSLVQPLFALDPDQPLNQLYHSSWTAKDGLRGIVTAIEQTSDGFLWVGTTEGLFRFDGLTFEAYKPEVGAFPSTIVIALCATPDGLWIGYLSGGVSFLKNGKIKNYNDKDGLPVAKIRWIARDHDGTVWVAAVGGLARFDGERWQKVRLNWNFTAKSAQTVFVDQNGTLWAPTGSRILFLPKGARRFEDTGVHAAATILDLTVSRDGTIWYVDTSHHLFRLRKSPDGVMKVQEVMRSEAAALLLEQSGALWLLGERFLRVGHPEYLKEISGKKGEYLDQISGTPIVIFEDRESNLWVGTDQGLHRFRRRNLWWYPAPSKEQYFNLMLGESNEVWAAPRTAPILRVVSGKSIPGSLDSIFYSFREPSGRLSVSRHDGIWTWMRGRFVKQPVPKEVDEILPVKPSDPMFVTSATTDQSGRLWIAIAGRGEFWVKDGQWHFVVVRADHPDWSANASLADRGDRIWLAHGAHLAVYKDGITQIYDDKEGPGVGPIKAIRELKNNLLVGGELGLSVFHHGRFQLLLPVDGDSFGLVTSIVATEKDGVWLAAAPGIVHIGADEIIRATEQSGYRVKCDVLDLVTDLPEPLQRGLSQGEAIQDSDGMLWFATMKGFARVNPVLTRNNLVPPVVIRSMIADDHPYSVFADATLPALTRSVHFDYTSPSLSIPERVQFRYRLEGFDSGWRDSGTSRQAVYNNLKPGSYRFSVIARNSDGVWNQTGAAIPFTLLPAWYQTRWFMAACVVLAFLVLWVAYRLRLQQVAHAMSTRFDERMAERTRIARELHDTLLQTIQASKLISDDALERRDDSTGMGHAMERISEWLGQAVLEGRAALNSLRTSTIMTNDLAAAFWQTMQEGTVPASMKSELVVIGEAKEMHPIVRDEIYRIGDEAIRNAILHSSATKLFVELRYERDLTIKISDNGVGILPRVVEEGKPGHFGLTGMKERAHRIAADIQIASTADGGTTITLHVPGHVIFIADGSKRSSLFAMFRRLRYRDQ